MTLQSDMQSDMLLLSYSAYALTRADADEHVFPFNSPELLLEVSPYANREHVLRAHVLDHNICATVMLQRCWVLQLARPTDGVGKPFDPTFDLTTMH